MKASPIIALTSLFLLSPAIVQGKKGFWGIFSSRNNAGHLEEDVPTVSLNNGREFPLVGLGVGNLPSERIETMIYEGLKSENKIHLIDTSRSSGNEKEVAKGITTGIELFKETQKDIADPIQVHVVTKVWYTHLGYDRTKISVEESIKDLSEAIEDPNVDLHLHVLIHWPRCYEGVDWMNCEEEENNLPADLKDATPAPHLDKDNAWKGSWRALEDMYNSPDYPVISGIGVSNFGHDELAELVEMARVVPTMIQTNVWSLLHDPYLVEICNKNKIHIQVFNIMHGLLGQAFHTPHAFHHLQLVANRLRKEAKTDMPRITAAQVVLKWLIQYDMSVVPRTASFRRLAQNSAASLSAIPDLNEENLEIAGNAIEAILTGRDVDNEVYVNVTFHASKKDMYLFYYPGEDGIEIEMATIKNGTSMTEASHPNHQFRLYDVDDMDNFETVTVNGSYGDLVDIHVELK